MNPILNAFNQGYSPEEIIGYISKIMPQLVPSIKKATRSGYTTQQILGFLSKNFDTEDREGMSESERHAANRRADAERTKYGLKMAGVGIAAPLVGKGVQLALSRSLPSLVQGLGLSGLPQNLGLPGPNASTIPGALNQNVSASAPTSQVPQAQIPISPSSSQPPILSPETIAQSSQIAQPKGIAIDANQILSKHNSKVKIDELVKAGNGPQEIVGYFKKFSPKVINDIEKESGQSFDKIIQDYLEKQPKSSEINLVESPNTQQIQKNVPEKEDLSSIGGMAKGMMDNFYEGIFNSLKEGKTKFAGIEEPLIKKAKPLFDEGKIKSPEDLKRFANNPKSFEEPKPVAKNDVVMTPHGPGEVIASRNGKTIVEVDGKKHQVEEKKLLKPPKEAAVEALELIKSFTPEEMRSTHHMLNSYDEEEKKGFFVFHNGSAYVVDDISPEDYKELSEEIEKAKTTGETIIGKWASGEGSRGAAYNKIVKGVRERKVVPSLKKTYRKLKVGYNLLAEWQRLLGEHEKELKQK